MYNEEDEEITDNESRSASATMITVLGVLGGAIVLLILLSFYIVQQVVKP